MNVLDCFRRPSALKLAVFFALGLLIAEAWVFLSTYLDPNLTYPFNQVFYLANDRGGDFFTSAKIPDFYPMFWTTPPLTQMYSFLAKGLVAIFPGGLAITIFSLVWILPFWYALSRMVPDKNKYLASGLLTLTCYPVLFCLDRGHFAGLVLTAIAFALNDLEFDGGKKAKYFIAIAAALKIVPIGFILIFLYRRNFKDAALTVLMAVALTLASGLLIRWAFLPDYDDRTWTEGMRLYVELAALSPTIDFDSTLWAGIRNSLVIAGVSSKELLRSLLGPYQIATFVAGVGLLIGAVRKFWTIQDLTILIVLYLLLCPPVMQEYYLTFLLFPALSLMRNPRASVNPWLIWLLAFITLPKPFFILSDAPIRLSTLLNPALLLLALLYVAITGFNLRVTEQTATHR